MSYEKWLSDIYNETDWFKAWEELQDENYQYRKIIEKELGSDRIYDENDMHIGTPKHGLSYKFEEFQNEIDQLQKENEELKMSIAYARQFYHLPQMVLDLFGTVVPCSKYDSKVDGDFYNRTISKELK